MHRRITILQSRPLAISMAWFALFLPLLAVAPLSAQVPDPAVQIPPEAQENLAELQAQLEQGQKLEAERRWGEALSHYEELLRSYPGRPDIRQRVSVTRTHYDLTRRYADQSFVRELAALSEQQALDIYAEVLLKINTHYVHAAAWRQLVDEGAAALAVAMEDTAFVKQYLANVPEQQRTSFAASLPRQMQNRQVRTRQEALTAALVAGRLAQQQLGLASPVVIQEFTCAAASSLDTYSSYLTGAQLDDIYSQIEGNFVGLGIELKSEDGALLIVNVIEGSPAQQGGLKSGDRIVRVDGRSTADVSTDKAADLLKGEEGSTVDLQVLNAADQARMIRLRRQRVEVPSVEDVKMIDQEAGIGYFRLTSFQKTTVRDVDAALWKLHRAGMRRLVIDVRGNPGGLLTSSVEVADKFVTSGTIVSTRGRSNREDFDYKAHVAGTWHVPLAVLIDGDTASAGEIFAGAIRDLNRGQVIGQRSYGKGSVQGIFPLHLSKAGVRLTTAKFYSPAGIAISHRGVTPTVEVRVAAKPIEGDPNQVAARDTVLDSAVQIMRGNLSQR